VRCWCSGLNLFEAGNSGASTTGLLVSAFITGAFVGALIGASTGAMVGGATKGLLVGVLLGALVGAEAGALVGGATIGLLVCQGGRLGRSLYKGIGRYISRCIGRNRCDWSISRFLDRGLRGGFAGALVGARTGAAMDVGKEETMVKITVMGVPATPVPLVPEKGVACVRFTMPNCAQAETWAPLLPQRPTVRHLAPII
jgi:hypothetical protein